MELESETSSSSRSMPEPHRMEGDGSPRPASLDESRRSLKKEKTKPFSVQFEVDIMQCFLFIASMATRLWLLGLPRAVVFDELHFAKFAALYMNKIFYFDVHPPLGKMLLALAGGFSGLEGNFNFDHIGAEYAPSFPVYQLRLVPAILGSLVVPLVYQIAVELHLSRWAALLAGIFVLLDNALLVQCRFMLMEGMLLFFLCLSLYSFLKFRHLSHRNFSVQWWFWLIMTGISYTCTLSIKYVGFFTAILILVLVIKDYWHMLADTTVSDMSLVKHLIARFIFLFAVPLSIYVSVFYVHLSILTKAGPHDNIMTSAFQASLEGGLATLTKGQPLNVAYGSQITLRQANSVVPGRSCWLHSHPYVYPIKYPDGRGSSHQQQVTCYLFKDVNNWWIVKDPERNSLIVDERPKPVKHGDIVQLVHGITSRALNSHDVAAPITPHNQEVTCYIDYNISMPAQNRWRVEIVNRQSDDENWQTIKSHVRLIHVNTSQALKSTGKQLPEWGFNQIEVSTDRINDQPATIWNVEEHRYTKVCVDCLQPKVCGHRNLAWCNGRYTCPWWGNNTIYSCREGMTKESQSKVEDKDDQARDLAQAEMIPTEPTVLSFWTKFFELQYKMFLAKGDIDMEHKYSSQPLDWPFMSKNVAYWMSKESNAQIHLIGNAVIWYCATLSVVTYLALLVFYLMRRRRGIFDLTEGEWSHFIFVGEMLVGGYLLHYMPYFLTERTLFLHSYLPCVVFKILVLSALGDHLYIISKRFPYIPLVLTYLTAALVCSALWVFYKLSALSYGNTDLSKEEILALTWKEAWDFLIHVKV